MDSDKSALCQLQGFLQDDTARLFRLPYEHPHRPAGLCCGAKSRLGTSGVYVRGALMELAFKLPFNSFRVRTLRWMGVKVGRNVYLGYAVEVDPVYPNLLTIEDDVYIGAGARIYTHEFRRTEFRAGRTVIRRGAFVGAHSMIAAGVEVGENSTVGAAALLTKDVPPGRTAVGNPVRIIRSLRSIKQEDPME